MHLHVSSLADNTTTATSSAVTSAPGGGGRKQDRLISTLCADLHLQKLGLTSKSTCSQVLKTVLSACVTAFEMAADESHDRKDWISSGSERSLQEPSSQRSTKLNITEDVSHRPYIFWAFTTMQLMLQTCRDCELEAPLEQVAETLRTLHSPDRSSYDPIEELASPAMMTRLLRLANCSANASFNFCIFSICNAVLNRANRKITTVNALLHDPHAQFQLQVMTDTDIDTDASARGSLPIVPLLRQWEKQLLHHAQGLCAAFTTMLFPPSPSSSKINSSGSSPFHQIPNHTLGGFSTEYKVLRLCSGRLLTESAHHRVNSRYTRELFQVLSEASTLQRSLLKAVKSKERCVLMTSLLHEDVVNDWRTAHALHLAASVVPSLDMSGKSADPSSILGRVEAPYPSLTVAHVTSSALLITWANIPEDEDWNSAVQRASAASTSGPSCSVSPGSGNGGAPASSSSSGGGSGISLSASVGGLLASIKGTLSYSQPNHTSFSLYITPIYRTVEQGSGAQGSAHNPLSQPKSKSCCHEAETTLVMPFVTPHGSHKVDLLDPG